MTLRITGILVISVMNGYFSHLVIGYCFEKSDNFTLTEASETITFNSESYSDCKWTLPPMPMEDYFFVFNISNIYILSGTLKVSGINVIPNGNRSTCTVFSASSSSSSSSSKPCPQRIGKYDECEDIGIKTSSLLPLRLRSSKARFTAQYDFISCQATTPSPVISTSTKSAARTPKSLTMQTSTRTSPLSAGSPNGKDYAEAPPQLPVISTSPKSASQTPKTLTMQTSTRTSPPLFAGPPNEKDDTEDDGLSASQSTLPFVISIAILVILLLISFAIILLLNHRLRMAKADHLESMVRFLKDKEPQAQASPVFLNAMDVGPYAAVTNQQPRVEESRHRGGGVGEHAQTQQATGYAAVNVNASQYAAIAPKQQRINASYAPDADAGNQPAQSGEIASSSAPSSSCVYATVNKPPK